MQENTQEQTLVTAQVGATAQDPLAENNETPEVQKTPAEQAAEAVRIAKQLSKGENLLLEREIWAYMNALTAPGVNENRKLQLKKSMARAIQFGVNFMSGSSPVQLQNFGQLSQIENNLARAIVKLAEYNTLQMADNMRKMEEAQANPEEGVKPLSELQTEDSNNETKE